MDAADGGIAADVGLSDGLDSQAGAGAGPTLLDHELLSSLIANPRLIHKLILNVTWNWTTIAFLIMRPETFAFVALIFCIFCLSHTFDLWSGVLANRVHKLSQHASWIRFLSPVRSLDSSERLSFFTSGLQDCSHVRQGNVGVYAIRGRRGNMEDMYDYVDEIDRLGVELFGVFDGHGSDVSVCYAHLVCPCFFCCCYALQLSLLLPSSSSSLPMFPCSAFDSVSRLLPASVAAAAVIHSLTHSH